VHRLGHQEPRIAIPSPDGSPGAVPVSTSVSQYSLPAAAIAGSTGGANPYSWLARCPPRSKNVVSL